MFVTDRRTALIGLALLALGRPAGAGTPETPGPDTAMRVLRDPDCGCCGAWVDIVAAAGFAVTVQMTDPAALQDHKARHGITPNLASCHTAHIGGYVIEGHVPVADIRRLLAERPDAIGLTVPGMPFGSPGMGPESEREAYDVLLLRRDGRTEIFTAYGAA